MSAVLAYIGAHWIQWVFAAATAFLGYLYRRISTSLHTEQERNKAIAEGVQALLRESILGAYSKWSDKGYCPIYAKESLRRVYSVYHNGLGGNDIASGLYNKVLAMPEQPEGGPEA